jgi:hypothetical protein
MSSSSMSSFQAFDSTGVGASALDGLEPAEASQPRVLAVLCHTDECCPIISVEPHAAPERQIQISDDFGQQIQMSRAQFQVLVDLAQQGKLAV